MRRFLLCLLLLPLATPCFAQIVPQLLASDGNLYGADDGFYSLNPATGQQTILNASAPEYGLTLCLERSDGTLLAIGSNALNTWQAFDITLAGAIKTIAAFPSSVTGAPVCPALANDGNYYGNSQYNGDYNKGFIYQLTAAGKINIFYNFTGGQDGDGPQFPPVQASDGNLYWFNGDLLLRYSPATGLTPLTLTDSGYSGYAPLLEAADDNFYAPSDGVVLQITPKGASSVIYYPPSADGGEEDGSVTSVYLTGNGSYPLAAQLEFSYTNYDGEGGCTATGNYFPMYSLSLAGIAGGEYFSIGADEIDDDPVYEYAVADDYSAGLVFGGNGNFYAAISDDSLTNSGSAGNCQPTSTITSSNQTYDITGDAPITMALNPSHIKPGGTSTLTWQVNNAFSDTMQQCFGFGNGLSGKLATTGSATVSASAAGAYLSSIVCGGTETGLATLTVGNATLGLTAPAGVFQGSPATLYATVTNAGMPAATGKVNFLLGSTVIGTATLVNNVATLTASTAGVPPGTYNIVASYVGDANYGPATSASVRITVLAKGTTSTALTPTTQTLLQGGSASLTATVTTNSPYGAPTGSVKFLVGTTTVGTVALAYENSTASSATLTASTASIAAGAYSVSASYTGDSGNLASNSNAVTVIVTPTTPVTLAISPNPVPVNTSFIMTATVKGKDSPSGTVFFHVNGTQDLASANVSGGVAQVTVPAGMLAAGTYQITAQYAGDSNNPAGTSPAVSLTVQ